MCLIVVGWQAHPDYPLIVAANRDEFYERPTAAAARWADCPRVLAGRDLEAGGTWLGLTEDGRFAAVTNVREPGQPPGRLSRGQLTGDYLRGTASAAEAIAKVVDADYAGYNLLLGDAGTLYYRTNRHGGVEPLAPGIYGLSNHRLDTPWPKLTTARDGFAAALARLPDEAALEEALFALLADASTVDDEFLPKTGVTLEWERRLSAIFVQSENYGTRASTVVLRRRDGSLRLVERSFGPHGRPLQSSLISTGV